MELEIKGMMMQAKEEAKKIVLESENKAVETLKDIKKEAKEKRMRPDCGSAPYKKGRFVGSKTN